MAPASPVIASWPSVPRLAITQSNKPRCSNSSAAASENSVFRPPRPSPCTVTVASPPPKTTSTDSGSPATNETNLRPSSAGLALHILPDDPAFETERGRLVRRGLNRGGIVTDDEQDVLLLANRLQFT